MDAQKLIQWCREHREGRPDGDIRSSAVLAEVLRSLLSTHLMETAPADIPRRLVSMSSGFNYLDAQPAPERQPEDTSLTARQLATLIGYIEDLRG